MVVKGLQISCLGLPCGEKKKKTATKMSKNDTTHKVLIIKNV